MRPEDKVVTAALILGLVTWMVDSVLTYFFIHTATFWDLLIINVPRHDLYTRSLVLVCFLVFGILVCRVMARQQEALEEISVLRGILPICANCKKIRDDEGHWQELEAYIGQRSGAEFSHGICPDCFRKLYPLSTQGISDNEVVDND